MAKNNNLTDFLTGVANAIRTKKGTSDLINPQDFESEISSIKTEKPEQEKSISISTNGTTEVTPDSGKVLSKVSVTTNVQPTLQEKTVAPTTTQQIVTADSGKDGLSKVTVEAVTSSIDSNIVAENIKKDVSILGVTGTLESGASLNIEYSDTAPADTSKLWVKSATPANVKITPTFASAETMNSVSATLPTGAFSIAGAAVGPKIYLFGGSIGSSKLSSINVFDTATNTIATLSTTLPSAASGIACAAVGTKIYLFGGSGSGSSNNLRSINVFDTATNTITTLSATLPTAASNIACAAVGTKIYLFGGATASRINTINVFDTTTNTIATLSTKLPTAASEITSAAVGTKIYLFGGFSSNGELNTINVFDTTTNTIATLSTKLPTAAYAITSAAVGTKIYLFGGYSSSRLSSINVFDTTTNEITTLSTTLPTATAYIASATVGTKIYLFGGYSSAYLNTISQFVVSADLASGNILVVTNTTNLFSLISSDAVSLEVGIANIYKGNTDNQAELCDAYLHNGTNWVNVNTGVLYPPSTSSGGSER